MSIEAGSLDKRISLERLVEVVNPATGARTKTWVEFGKVWANIRFQSGAETLRADTPVSAAKASIRIWHRNDFDASCRVVHKTTIFDILAVLPHGTEYMDLACQTGANNG